MTHKLTHTGTHEVLECDDYALLYRQAVSFVRTCRRNHMTGECQHCMYAWYDEKNNRPLLYAERHFATCDAYLRGEWPEILLDDEPIKYQ